MLGRNPARIISSVEFLEATIRRGFDLPQPPASTHTKSAAAIPRPAIQDLRTSIIADRRRPEGGLVCRRALNVINHKDLDGTFGGFELQPELFLQGSENRRICGIGCGSGGSAGPLGMGSPAVEASGVKLM